MFYVTPEIGQVENILVSDNGGEVSVQWDYEQPNVCSYNVYVDGILLKQTDDLLYTFEGLIWTSCQYYSISVAAVSSSGQVGIPTNVNYENSNYTYNIF